MYVRKVYHSEYLLGQHRFKWSYCKTSWIQIWH